MKNINFLPERYQERDLKRKAAIWQYALLLGFGGVILAATIGQFTIKRSLRAGMTELNEPRINTKLRREQVELLKQKLRNDEEFAALYTYLRHPWPRTQLLAKITELLPSQCVILEGIEILEQQPNRSAFVSTESPDGSSGAPPAAADLAQLRREHDETQLVVRIRGTVDDTEKLNDYVRQLGEAALFRSVSLSSLKTKASSDEEPRSEFELNVKVRPGHGQSGGPREPIEKRIHTARYLPGRQPR